MDTYQLALSDLRHCIVKRYAGDVCLIEKYIYGPSKLRPFALAESSNFPI